MKVFVPDKQIEKIVGEIKRQFLAGADATDPADVIFTRLGREIVPHYMRVFFRTVNEERDPVHHAEAVTRLCGWMLAQLVASELDPGKRRAALRHLLAAKMLQASR